MMELVKMINWIKSLFQPEYLEWKDYKEKITFIEDFHFQQKVRNDNIKRL